jgi:hypothetical protein
MPALSRRFFNTAGPCRAEDHYMLPPLRRLPELQRLVAERQFYSLHAARQTGKTTAMLAFAEELRTNGAVALHTSLETARQTPAVEAAEPRWLRAIFDSARWALVPGERPPPLAEVLGGEPGTRLGTYLSDWAAALHPRPLVLLFDEVDCVEGEAMVSLLGQLRAGFSLRPRAFPSSIALIGMRDPKDYLVESKGGAPPNPGSPFNIKAASLTLSSFTLEDVAELYGQHAGDTGQPFTDAAIDRAYQLSQGQPFLVNALAYHLTREQPVPTPTPITAADIDRAKEHLVRARTTHLDNLSHRLYEPRVAAILRPILMGDPVPSGRDEDVEYSIDLGLIRRESGGLALANPIYREVLPRALSATREMSLADPWWPWRRAGGGLDLPALIDAPSDDDPAG